MESINLQLGSIESRNLTSSFKANGFLKVPNQNKATVTSLYTGVVKELFVMPGSVVKKGMPIATIANPQFIPMQEEYLGLATKITLAKTQFTRQQELVSGNAGALKNLQTSETELKSLRIRQISLEQQLSLMGIVASELTAEKMITQIPVRTPIGGSVSNVLVNLGAYINAEMPIAEVVDNSQLHLDLFVYEKDLPLVHKNQSIDFILTNQPGKSYTAEVFSVGTTFESETKAIAVHCIVKGDKQGLIEGMSITAQLNTADAHVPALPSEAIVNHDGTDFVFVREINRMEDPHHHEVGEDDHEDESQMQDGVIENNETIFRRIPVKKGMTKFGYTEIVLLTEIPDDAHFVIRGAFFLMAKMTNAGEAHSH
jgi:RND family efflux transporter MFP subunit